MSGGLKVFSDIYKAAAELPANLSSKEELKPKISKLSQEIQKLDVRKIREDLAQISEKVNLAKIKHIPYTDENGKFSLESLIKNTNEYIESNEVGDNPLMAMEIASKTLKILEFCDKKLSQDETLIGNNVIPIKKISGQISQFLKSIIADSALPQKYINAAKYIISPRFSENVQSPANPSLGQVTTDLVKKIQSRDKLQSRLELNFSKLGDKAYEDFSSKNSLLSIINKIENHVSKLIRPGLNLDESDKSVIADSLKNLKSAVNLLKYEIHNNKDDLNINNIALNMQKHEIYKLNSFISSLESVLK